MHIHVQTHIMHTITHLCMYMYSRQQKKVHVLSLYYDRSTERTVLYFYHCVKTYN